MKKLILSALACIALVISSCNQNSPSPAPAPAAPAPTPTSSMTATEALLVGDWIWDKTEAYQSGNLSVTNTPSTQISASGTMTTTLHAGSHMVLKSSFYNGTATTNSLVPQDYNVDVYAPNYVSNSGFWSTSTIANGTTLVIAAYAGAVCGSGYIITLNANTLIYHSWIPGQIANGSKFYYHK
jgi:hypothetical protein